MKMKQKTENAADSGLPVPHGCRHGKRPMGGVRPRQSCPKHHQLRQGDGGNRRDESQHPERLPWKRKKVFEQGKAYYDALKSVHDVIRGGTKVAKSVGLVMEISETYVDNYQKMLSDENYTPEELAAISSGYAMLIDESSDVLQDLKNVVNVTGMSLTDAERLAIIENAYRNLLNYRNLVRYYTNKTISVSYLRARKKDDMDRVTALYGNPNEKYW